MSLYRRPDSKFWWACITLPNGKAVRISTGTGDKKSAQEWEAKTRHEAWQQHRLGIKPQYVWEDAVVKWHEEFSHKDSFKDDLSKLRWLDAHLHGVALVDITRQLIMEIGAIKAKEASPATANRHLALIRSILRRAMYEWEWIEKVPKIRLYPEPKRRIRFLTQEEAEALLACLPDYHRDIVLFALATGLRQGNIVGLEWSQVDLSRRVAWKHADETKPGTAITVPLNQMALEVLQRQVGKHPTRVFTYRGKPIKWVNTRVWRRALAECGIENFRWHDLRHTFATWLAMNGATMLELQELGGWKSQEMVRRYAHFSADHLLGAASKLDRCFTFFSRPEEKRA